MADGFGELDDFERDLLALAQDFERGKEAKKFLRKQGSKLNRQNKKQARLLGIGKKTGNFMKGFKRGKPYKYQGKHLSIRAYNGSPHAHLLDQGHRITDKQGNEYGFAQGFHFMDKAKEQLEEEYYRATRDFIDDMINNHGM